MFKAMITLILILQATMAYCFDGGWIFNIQANVGGSTTTPIIDDSDLSKMGASYMKGMTGFVNSGEVQIGYVFSMDDILNKGGEVSIDTAEKKSSKIISGVGVFGVIGVGQGYAGQVSGAKVPVEGVDLDVDVFFNVYYTPVVSFGAMGKLYFLDNRLALGLGIGGRIIADTSPQYDFYSSHPDISDGLKPAVGTIIVDSWMVKNMNPLMFNTKVSIEYNQPVLERMEIILGGYLGYDVFKPKYITMPPSLLALARINGFDPQEELKSFYLNSLNYGIIVGLGFKI